MDGSKTLFLTPKEEWTDSTWISMSATLDLTPTRNLKLGTTHTIIKSSAPLPPGEKFYVVKYPVEGSLVGYVAYLETEVVLITIPNVCPEPPSVETAVCEDGKWVVNGSLTVNDEIVVSGLLVIYENLTLSAPLVIEVSETGSGSVHVLGCAEINGPLVISLSRPVVDGEVRTSWLGAQFADLTACRNC